MNMTHPKVFVWVFFISNYSMLPFVKSSQNEEIKKHYSWFIYERGNQAFEVKKELSCLQAHSPSTHDKENE